VAAVEGASLDGFEALVEHLARLHPSRYGALVDGLPLVGITGARPVGDQAAALRLVVLADRLYDRDVPVVTSGVPMDRCSRTSCCRAATARSTCGRSRG
jgi:cell division protein ZapE